MTKFKSNYGEGDGNPLQYSFLGNPMGRGVWQATVYGVSRVGHDLVTKPTNQPMKRTLSKLGIKENFFILMKHLWKNLQLKRHLVVKRLQAYSLRLGPLTALTVSSQHWTGGSGHCNKLILKLMEKNKGTRIAKTIWKKEITKVEGLTLPDFRTTYSYSNLKCGISI